MGFAPRPCLNERLLAQGLKLDAANALLLATHQSSTCTTYHILA